MKARITECNRKKATIVQELSQMKNQFNRKDEIQKQVTELIDQLDTLKERKIDEEESRNKMNKEFQDITKQITENQYKRVIVFLFELNLTKRFM